MAETAKTEKNISPEFDDHDFEKILEWGKATIENCDHPTTGESEGYTLSWKNGFIHLDVDKEEQAKKAAALFIYFWTRGIHAAYAERAAVAYVRTWTIRKVK